MTSPKNTTRVIELPPEIITILAQVNDISVRTTGIPAYITGGFVRDHLLGIGDYHDIDVSVPDADAVFKLANLKFVPSGESKTEFGVQSVFVPLGSGVTGRLDIVQLRSEAYRADSRKPTIKPTTDIIFDLSRRDFTRNAIAWKLVSFNNASVTVEEIDPFNGIGDLLYYKVIKAVGDPNERFFEDPLRIMRAVRFATKLDNVVIDINTQKSITSNVNRLQDGGPVSRERIVDELTKILVLPNAGKGVKMLFDLGILQFLIPEFAEAGNIRHDNRGGHHGETIIEHTAEAVSRIAPEPTLRIAALLHDVGKTSVYSSVDGKKHFFVKDPETGRTVGHESVSAEVAARRLKELKFPSSIVREVTTLVKFHMRLHMVSKDSDESKRKSMAKVYISLRRDANLIDKLIKLGEADSGQSYAYFSELLNEYSHVKLVNGLDILAIEPGLDTTNPKVLERALRETQVQQLSRGWTFPKLVGVMKNNINNAKKPSDDARKSTVIEAKVEQ
ncbi:MAG: CCA tRNA nucleotidyltransferase [Nitrososphaerota archaeon]|nr:CCA tRNA nucleotidyltransferase [Nitrososphaerota archaeon]